jgi:peptide/nickel transport system permease protein
MAPPVIGYAVRRFAFALIAVWFASTLTFIIIQLAPGDPVTALLGDYAAAGQSQDLAASLGLDRSRIALYGDWLARAATGDLGRSFRSQVPVLTLIAERAPVTLALMLPALAISTAAGLAIGLAAARRQGQSPATVAMLALFNAVPGYVVAQTLVLVFALGLGWLPVQGLTNARTGGSGFLDTLRHLVLPILSLSILQVSYVALIARVRVSEELRRQYCLTAVAKGLTPGQVKWRHALTNAAIPLITLIGWRFGAVVGGAVVVETVFALPGIGRLAITAALSRDYPVVIGVVLIACALTVVVNVVVDVVAHRLDPRIAEAIRR